MRISHVGEGENKSGVGMERDVGWISECAARPHAAKSRKQARGMDERRRVGGG